MKQEIIKHCCELIDRLTIFVMQNCKFNIMTRGEFAMMKMFCDAEKIGEHLTITQISGLIDVSKAAVSQMVSNLEKKEWVIRKNDNDDKRRIYICVTDDGKKAYEEQLGGIGENLKQCFNGVTESELVNLSNSLEVIESKIKK